MVNARPKNNIVCSTSEIDLWLVTDMISCTLQPMVC